METSIEELAHVKEADRLATKESFHFHFEDTVSAFRKALPDEDLEDHTEAIARLVAARLQHEQLLINSRVVLHVPELSYKAAISAVEGAGGGNPFGGNQDDDFDLSDLPAGAIEAFAAVFGAATPPDPNDPEAVKRHAILTGKWDPSTQPAPKPADQENVAGQNDPVDPDPVDDNPVPGDITEIGVA